MKNKLRQLQQSRLAKNYIFHVAYQIISALLLMVTVPYTARVLGAENIGIYSYTLSIATYFIVFGSLGIGLYGQREIAYCQDKPRRRTKIFREIALLRFITAIITLAIFACLFILNPNDYQLYFQILLIEIIANAINIDWFFHGTEQFKTIAIRNTAIKLLSVASIFLFVKAPSDLPIYCLIHVLTSLVSNLSLWFCLPKYLVKTSSQKLHIWQHFKPLLQLFIPQVAIQVYTILDKTMLGYLITDKSEVGYYDQSQKVIKLLLTVITALGTVMMPRIASTFAKKDYAKIKHYLTQSLKFTMALTLPMMLGIFLFADPFVPIFFGAGYEPVALLMKVASPVLLLIGISNIIGTQYLLPTQKLRIYTSSVVAGAITNFCLNLWLIPSLGALGATFGTLAAETVVAIIQLFAIRHDPILRKQSRR